MVGIAGFGVALGHWVTYAVDVPDAHARAGVLAGTGHAYLPLATQLAVVAGIAASAIVLLGRLMGRDHGRTPWNTFARLAGFQVGTFISMEVLERVASGSSVIHLLHGTILPVGILVQVAIAGVGAALLWLLLRTVDAIADRLAGATLSRRPTIAWIRSGDRTWFPRGAVWWTSAIRGPPSLLRV